MPIPEKLTPLPLFLLHNKTGRLYIRVRLSVMEKAGRDLSKLTRTVITDKNGHRRTIYIRLEEPERKGSKVKTPGFSEWLGDGERLLDLTVSSDGASRQKAIDALDALAGKELVNAETGIKARISGAQRNKIVSNAAMDKSGENGFNSRQHFAVASRIGNAWKHATLVETRSDLEMDTNIVSIKRFEAPIKLDDEPAVAYITAKESVAHGHRIYSLELKCIKKPAGTGGRPITRTTPAGLGPADKSGNTLN